MTNSNGSDAPADLQKYGVPFYGTGWVPYNHIRFRPKPASEDKNDEDKLSKDDYEVSASRNYVVFAGGGGEGRSGIPNAIIVSHVDLASNSLSDQPVFRLKTDSDLPYRMAVHPRGDGIICALQQSCRLFEWDEREVDEVHKLGVKVSEKVLTQLEDVEQQLAVRFNSDGSVLAAGGEDGSLRVFKWPSMETILNEAQAHSSVKDLDFSCDGKFLVSLGGALCRVWDVTSSKVVASLPKGNDEVFAFSRFSQINDKNEVLYIAAVTDHGGSILTWNTTTWKRMRTNRVVREPISALNVSADGKLLAVGTVGGDLFIINSSNMRVQMMVKKAHLGLVTALTFSQDSRAVISASLDSSARLTLIKEKPKSGGMSWLIVFVVLLAIAVYFMKEKGIIL